MAKSLDTAAAHVLWSIEMHQDLLLKVTEDLTEEQFSRQPGPLAPPIGWHLWHITRWADRLQAGFNHNNHDIWTTDSLASRWEVDPSKLGKLETGIEMEVEEAVNLMQVGKDAILDYSHHVFEAFDQSVSDLHSDNQLFEPYVSGRNGETSRLADDLFFHLRHISRHLGMIEALRGAMFEMAGTASN